MGMARWSKPINAQHDIVITPPQVCHLAGPLHRRGRDRRAPLLCKAPVLPREGHALERGAPAPGACVRGSVRAACPSGGTPPVLHTGWAVCGGCCGEAPRCVPRHGAPAPGVWGCRQPW